MARTPRRRSTPDGMPPPAGASPPELVVLTRTEADVAASAAGVRSRAGMRTDRLQSILSDARASMVPIFGATEERARRNFAAAAASAGGPDPGIFYRVEAEGNLEALAAALRETDPVEAAFVKPPSEPPRWRDPNEDAAAAAASAAIDAPPATPDFTARQGYLDAAPGGIDARWAWTQPGGRGANVRIIDIEGEWRFTHEDLTANQGGVIGGNLPPAADRLTWRNHGTAVIGVFGGDANAIGVTGICPDAHTSAHSIFGVGSAAAITTAAMRLGAGDILLLELHRPGPRNNFQSRQDQHGYIAIEWWPDDFAAILFATQRGIIVVEAAGNGAQNLDDAIYSTRPNNFPVTWRNPFNRNNPDCGAVIVGAGAPSTLNHGPDRSRLDFSNFGACVDAQGWGRDVVTCGYGDLQGGRNEDLWYTAQFSGTSSASPVVVGALGCIQGILRARGRPLLTPATARAQLRATGSPQQDAPGRPTTQRIGNRPNIRAVIDRLIPKTVETKNLLKDAADKRLDKSQLEKISEKSAAKDVIDKVGDKLKETKETKDTKEKDSKEKEVKETKDGKDSKEKELKDGKEKEVKDVKDADKNFSKEIRDHLASAPLSGMPSDPAGLEARVAALEAAFAQLTGSAAQHFIGAGLRPDVGVGAYADPGAGAERIQMLERMKAEIEAALAAARGS